MYFDYDEDLGESVAWIDNFGATLREEKLCFDTKHSKLEIPYFAMMDWNVGIFLSFFFDGAGLLSQNEGALLLTNGNEVHSATIEVVLSGGNITTTLITHNELSLCTVTLPVSSCNVPS